MKSHDIPIIGITTYGRDEKRNFYLPSEYLDSVRNAGGLPVLLTPGEKHIEGIYAFVDGVIFAGGGDFDPAVYGGKPHPTIKHVDKERDDFELGLAEYALAHEKPVLGICRGSQLLNVVSGGSLLPDVPERFGFKVVHRADDGGDIEHEVKVERDSKLFDIFGKECLVVASKHHQGFDRISDIWKISAQAEDGVVEAIEHKDHPWIVGVLWHPELSPNDPNHKNFLKHFVGEVNHSKGISN